MYYPVSPGKSTGYSLEKIVSWQHVLSLVKLFSQRRSCSHWMYSGDRGEYLRCCKICYPLCAFVILAACVVACVGLVWMQVALKEDLDALKEKFRTSKWSSGFQVLAKIGPCWMRNLPILGGNYTFCSIDFLNCQLNCSNTYLFSTCEQILCYVPSGVWNYDIEVNSVQRGRAVDQEPRALFRPHL